MSTDQNLPKEDNAMSNDHNDNCDNPETMCEDCLLTASEDHEPAE
jgi:hypothetical protein